MNSVSFSKFCDELGFQFKAQWYWCAVNEEKRQALFTVWDDRIAPDRKSIDFSWLADPSRRENGANKFRRDIARVLDEGFEAYGIRCLAKDPKASPRRRESFDEKLISLRVVKEGERTIAYFGAIRSADAVRQGAGVLEEFISSQSAIDDLDDAIGNALPQRSQSVELHFIRDAKIRQRVIKRAKGKCEQCGELGFAKFGGSYYLEAHHIISLAEQGPDTLDNVIALCANHHREAHYGENRIALEQHFLVTLAKLRGIK